MHGDEQKYIKEAFDTNWIAPLGPNVDALEREMAAYIGMGSAAALTSGTAALHLALKLCFVKPRDTVFCSDLTFAATANPISYEGGTQVFIDSERESWNMDPSALEKAFRKYPQCRCVVVVNLYGVPARLDEIRAICDEHGAVLIEDAAESLGASYKGHKTGSFGSFSTLSFNGNKIITASGGGMLLSGEKAAIEKARFWATQAREPALWYEHKEIGYNYRMSNVSAGIGRGQLPHLEEHIRLKKAIYERYKEAFAALPLTMNPHLESSVPNYWLSCALLDEDCGLSPLSIIKALAEENIEARPIWKPMHLQPVFKGCDFISADGDLSADLFTRGLCLPSDIKMTDTELERVISCVRGAFGGVK